MGNWIKAVAALVAILIVTVNGKPQFITLKDGKIGVNFGGYHAEAGLGGLLTGNGAHGGLSASAGTPFGQQAGAGLGGSVDGRTAGGLYAGASAGHGVGASAALGGAVDEYGAHGGEGAEAHAGGVSKKVVKVGSNGINKQITSVQYPDAGIDTRFADEEENEVPVHPVKKTKTKAPAPPREKVVIVEKKVHTPVYHSQTTLTSSNDQPALDYRHFLDFGFFSNAASHFGGAHTPGNGQVIVEKTYSAAPVHKVHLNKRIGVDNSGVSASGSGFVSSNHGPSPSFFDAIFNIPISTLSAVNSFLNGHVAGKSKHVSISSSVST